MRQMKRVSIAQIKAGHDECVIPLIHTLNQLGVQADVYISNQLRIKRGNIFKSLGIAHEEYIIDPSYSIDSIPHNSSNNRIFWLDIMGRKVCKLIRHNQEDSLPIMFWTSFRYPDSKIFNFCSKIGYNIYAFIHDSEKHQSFDGLSTYPKTTPVLFSDGMMDAPKLDEHQCLKFYLPPMTQSRIQVKSQEACKDPHSKIKIAVPGRVSYQRRDYELLVKFAKDLNTQYPCEFEFIIVGGVSGNDGDKFIESINANKLTDMFKLPLLKDSTEATEGNTAFLSYNQLFELLQSCDMALSNSKAVKEGSSKVSGAINLCINFQLPILYLKGYTMYKEFNGLGSFILDFENSSKINIFGDNNKEQLLTAKQAEATELKTLMEKSNLQAMEKIIM